MGEACRIAKAEMERDEKWVSFLAERLTTGITSQLEHVILNGDPEQRYPGNVNLSFAYVEGESLLMALKGIAVSSGSACTSASLEPSYVLRAIGVEEDLAHTSIRCVTLALLPRGRCMYSALTMPCHVLSCVRRQVWPGPLHDSGRGGLRGGAVCAGA